MTNETGKWNEGPILLALLPILSSDLQPLFLFFLALHDSFFNRMAPAIWDRLLAVPSYQSLSFRTLLHTILQFRVKRSARWCPVIRSPYMMSFNMSPSLLGSSLNSHRRLHCQRKRSVFLISISFSIGALVNVMSTSYRRQRRWMPSRQFSCLVYVFQVLLLKNILPRTHVWINFSFIRKISGLSSYVVLPNLAIAANFSAYPSKTTESRHIKWSVTSRTTSSMLADKDAWTYLPKNFAFLC